jgi:uncharacterized membrane protein (UPF0127 family)
MRRLLDVVLNRICILPGAMIMLLKTPAKFTAIWQQPGVSAMVGALLFSTAGHVLAQDITIGLYVLDQRVDVEIAATTADRVQGLSRRQALPENRGMLFVFRDVAPHIMWMRDTHIPLSVAFLDERGVIINIEDMAPDTLARHPASRPAKYALEVNRGWFDRHGVKPGMRIEGIEQAPLAD